MAELETASEKTKKKRRKLEKEQLEAIQNVRSYGVARKKSKVTWKRILIVIIFLLVVAGAAEVLVIFSRSKYTDAIDAQIDILNNREQNLETCLDAAVGDMKKNFVLDYASLLNEINGNSREWDNGLLGIFNSQYNILKKSFGDDFEVSYKVQNEKHLSEDELSYYYEDIGDYLSTGVEEMKESEDLRTEEADKIAALFESWKEKYSKVSVTDGYSVVVNLTYKAASQQKTVSARMVIVQIDGKWIVRVGSLLSLDSAKIFDNMEY